MHQEFEVIEQKGQSLMRLALSVIYKQGHTDI